MLVLRSRNGKTIPLPAGTEFVEVQTADGLVAVVAWKDASGTIHVTTSGEPDHRRYCEIFKLKAAPVTDIHIESGLSQ